MGLFIGSSKISRDDNIEGLLMESLKDGTSHGKLEFLFDGMSLGQ